MNKSQISQIEKVFESGDSNSGEKVQGDDDEELIRALLAKYKKDKGKAKAEETVNKMEGGKFKKAKSKTPLPTSKADIAEDKSEWTATVNIDGNHDYDIYDQVEEFFLKDL